MVGDPEAELSAIESMVTDWEQRGQERLARVKEVTDQVAGLSATATEGAVTVTVGANGLPTDIRIDESAKDRPMAELSTSIMATLRKAQAQIPKLMEEVAKQAGMAGDSVVSHLLSTAEQSFPDPEPEPGQAAPPRASDDEYFDAMQMLRDEEDR